MSKPTSLKAWIESAKRCEWYGIDYTIKTYKDKLVMCDCCGDAFLLLEETDFGNPFVARLMSIDRLIRMDVGLDSCAVQVDEEGKDHICYHCYIHAQ